MSSNAPPTTTSPDRPSTNNPQDLLITPNHIPVVTQNEGNSPFEQLIQAIAVTENQHVSPSYLANEYDDEMALDQIPAAPQTANETITTPIVNSPLKNRFSDRSSQLSGERERRKSDGVRLFEANSASKRRKLNRAIPSTSLLSFLRDNAINQRIEEYDGKIQDFSNTIKAALNSWSTKRVQSFAPFKDLKQTLENAPCPFKYNDGRMLLEDVLLLMPGEKVTLLISKTHSILSSARGGKRLMGLFKKTIQFNPLQPVQFGANLFFALRLTVRSNVHYTAAMVSSFNIISHYYHQSFNSLILSESACHCHHSIHHHLRTVSYPLMNAGVYL
jgi:hypothetical protein